MISFWTDGRPATKGSWQVNRNGSVRPQIQRERPWANAVAWSAKAAGIRPIAGAVRVTLEFHLLRPAKPAHPYPSRGDIDKLVRSCLDALTGIGYADDAQVVEVIARKQWAGERGPGAEISIATCSRVQPVRLGEPVLRQGEGQT